MSQRSIQQMVDEHLKTAKDTFTPEQVKTLDKMASEIAGTFQKGGKLLLCGNGGSAADAQHIAAEFIGRFKKERKSLPAIALTTDTSILTALGNDYSYDIVFARQVEGLGRPGDILIAISTSGNSKNILAAAQAAKKLGMRVYGFTGAGGGALKSLVDIQFTGASKHTPHVQEMHITALHAISEAAEDVLFP